MKISVIYNKYINGYKETLSRVEELLIKNHIEFKSFDIDNMELFGDIALVIGGDGTLLKAARGVNAGVNKDENIPVLGINIGRLGFLSQAASVNELIEAVLEGDYFVEERMMLKSSGKTALNDFVIKGCDSSRTSKFYLEINDREVCDYIADGLIISTPTGSTAYGLSAGGPVLYPTLDAITIVPICPHTLNARPLVVPSGEKITVRTGDKPLSVAVDGYDIEECVEKITICASDKKAKLAFLNNRRFYSVLRDKLHWGWSGGQ